MLHHCLFVFASYNILCVICSVLIYLQFEYCTFPFIFTWLHYLKWQFNIMKLCVCSVKSPVKTCLQKKHLATGWVSTTLTSLACWNTGHLCWDLLGPSLSCRMTKLVCSDSSNIISAAVTSMLLHPLPCTRLNLHGLLSDCMWRLPKWKILNLYFPACFFHWGKTLSNKFLI